MSNVDLPKQDTVANAFTLDAFNSDVQAKIAGKMRTTDLARMRAVNKSWKATADILEVRRDSFINTWGLAGAEGDPIKPNFYLAAGLGHFVIKVKQGPKSSVAALLVKYKTDSVALRVLNNCSEFSLHCRTHIYVPVANRGELAGRWVTFTHDSQCQRQLIVLQDHSNGVSKQLAQSERSTSGTFDTLARGNAAGSVAETQCDLDEADVDSSNREALLKKLSRQMGRGLNIDEGTAAYYLEQTQGDMKRAFSLYREDLAWETANPIGILPLREPIPTSE